MNDLGMLIRRSIERHAVLGTVPSMPRGTRPRIAARAIARVFGSLFVAGAVVAAFVVGFGVAAHHSPPGGQVANGGSDTSMWPEVRIGAGTASVPMEPVPERVDQQIAPWEAVAHGTSDGVGWTLSADREYLIALVDDPQSTNDWSEPGSCAVLSFNEGWQEAASCLAPRLGQIMVQGEHRWVQGRQVSGYAIAVLPGVSSVEIRLGDGESRSLPLFRGSDALDGMGYSVVFPPVGSSGQILALDDQGSELKAVTFCVPVVSGPGEDGASCPGDYPSDG